MEKKTVSTSPDNPGTIQTVELLHRQWLSKNAFEIELSRPPSFEFKAGQIAKLHVKKWFFPEDNYYFLKAEHRGLYGRWIGEVYKVDKTESLNEHLKLIFGKSPYWDWFHQEPLTEDWK